MAAVIHPITPLARCLDGQRDFGGQLVDDSGAPVPSGAFRYPCSASAHDDVFILGTQKNPVVVSGIALRVGVLRLDVNQIPVPIHAHLSRHPSADAKA